MKSGFLSPAGAPRSAGTQPPLDNARSSALSERRVVGVIPADAGPVSFITSAARDALDTPMMTSASAADDAVGAVPNTAPDTAAEHVTVQQEGVAAKLPLPGSEAWQQSLQHCLTLLRGPTDEKRFVGLLLVSKLLPSGGATVVRAVVDALGTRFIDRLLLPLTRTHKEAAQEAVQQGAQQHEGQQQLSCVLGLTLLSSACHLPELAAGHHLASLCPAFLKVVRLQGVSSLFPATTGATEQDSRAADSAAVSDALECLVAVATANSAARHALVKAGALASTARLLAEAQEHGVQHNNMPGKHVRGAAAVRTPVGLAGGTHGGTAEGRAGQTGGGTVRGTAQPNWLPVSSASVRQRMLALQLLAALLDGDAAHRSHVIAAHPEDVLLVIQRLSHQLGHPSLLLGAPDATSSACAGGTHSGGTGGGGTGSSGTALASDHQDAGVTRDLAKVQLDALHVLLLVLPPPEGSVLDTLLRRDAAAASGTDGWLSAARRGLGWVLRSRTGAVQKMSVLQLAAALIDLASHTWLLPDEPAEDHPAISHCPAATAVATATAATAAAMPPSSTRPGEVLQLITQAATVELPLLLHDAIRPGLSVPAGQGATAGGTQASTFSVGGSALDATPMDVSEAQPVQGVKQGCMQTAGERALSGLPAVFSVLEAAVEALAADAERGDNDEVGYEARGAPVLSDTTAHQLLSTLSGAMTSILQFFEAVEDLPAAELATVHPAVQLGAVRVLGRFLAEAPDSLLDALLPRLPYLLTVHGDDGGIAAPERGAATHDHVELSGPDDRFPTTSTTTIATTTATTSGAAFLLPALLQLATAGSTAGRLRTALQVAPDALLALAGHLQRLLMQATALTGLGSSVSLLSDDDDDVAAGRGTTGPGSSMMDLDDAAVAPLLTQQTAHLEQRAADVALLLLQVIRAVGSAADAGEEEEQAVRRRAAPLTGQTLPLLASIAAWGNARVVGVMTTPQATADDPSMASETSAARVSKHGADIGTDIAGLKALAGQLQASRLGAFPLMTLACLGAILLEAAPVTSPSVAPPQQSPTTVPPAASSPPHDVLQLVTAAVQVGQALRLMGRFVGSDAGGLHVPGGRESMRDEVAGWRDAVLDDFSDEAEECLERLETSLRVLTQHDMF